MLLYREDYYDPNTEKKGVAEVVLAKNRTGPVGNVDLAFLKQFTRFENLAARPTG
ncbi:MAG TPA: DnaB-like helicase C-terminal domain-containing protein [Planctomycetota bacterium]|nr:DnaB-like helicase C-terminal domain-containing protein [Planctomycetota bacterium]